MKKAKPDPQNGKCCANCLYWREQTETNDPVRWGKCHAGPPVGVLSRDPDSGDETFAAVWPPTDDTEWCGSWVPSQ